MNVTQPKNLGHLLKYDIQNYSRDVDIVAAGQYYHLGTVVGRNTTDKKLRQLNPNANDGTEIAVGILAENVDAWADTKAVVIARHAIVARNALVWPSGITDAQKAQAEEQLKFFGIIIRDTI